jgi:hypothetical protein
MTTKGWIGWLGLLWLVSVGVGAQEKGVVAVLTEVRGRQVRMQVVGEEGLKAGDRLTVVSAVTGQSVAHLRLLRVRPPNCGRCHHPRRRHRAGRRQSCAG